MQPVRSLKQIIPVCVHHGIQDNSVMVSAHVFSYIIMFCACLRTQDNSVKLNVYEESTRVCTLELIYLTMYKHLVIMRSFLTPLNVALQNRFYVLFSVPLCGYSSVPPQRGATQRIVGGVEVVEHSWPFIASLQVNTFKHLI